MAALFSRLFRRIVGKRWAYGFTMAGIVLYVLLVGADPVVVRAGVMGGPLVARQVAVSQQDCTVEDQAPMTASRNRGISVVLCHPTPVVCYDAPYGQRFLLRNQAEGGGQSWAY